MTRSPVNPPRPVDRSRAIRKPPPNYYSRKEQLRLFALCGLFMLVLVMMNEARKPSTWQWMWGETSSEIPNDPPITTRREIAVAELPDDGFTFDAPESHSAPEADQLLPGITPELLAPIEDNSVLRARENSAWLTMFRILGEKSLDDLEALSTSEVGFSQLYRQTDIYRGRLVTVVGTARRLEAIQPRPNDIGMTTLYRWIVAPAGGSNLPIVIYSREKPVELEPGLLEEQCRVTGFCFKRWAYNAADGPRIAPLLLARNIHWTPPPPTMPDRLPSRQLLTSVFVALAGLATIIAMVVYRSSVFRSPTVQRVRDWEAVSLDELNDQDVLPNVSESLDRLAENEKS